MGRTMILASVVSKEAMDNVDFHYIICHYQENLHLQVKWRIFKGRLSDLEVLICRLVDGY